MGTLETLAGVAGLLVVGAAKKHKTRIPHKATGVPTNVVLGQAASAVFGGTPQEGLELAIYTEAALNGAKGLYHAGRTIGEVVRRILGRE